MVTYSTLPMSLLSSPVLCMQLPVFSFLLWRRTQTELHCLAYQSTLRIDLSIQVRLWECTQPLFFSHSCWPVDWTWGYVCFLSIGFKHTAEWGLCRKDSLKLLTHLQMFCSLSGWTGQLHHTTLQRKGCVSIAECKHEKMWQMWQMWKRGANMTGCEKKSKSLAKQ